MKPFRYSEDISFFDSSLFLSSSQTLVFSDLHLGIEEHARKEGVLLPKTSSEKLMRKAESIIKEVKPKRIILNGDLKHEFGIISKSEWKLLLQFFDMLKRHTNDIIIIKGNHDTILKPVAEKRNLKLQDYFLITNHLIAHGDRLLDLKAIEKETGEKISCIIIGHDHPAIKLMSKNRSEQYKCFFIGKHKRKELIVMPSFHEITTGTNVLDNTFLSPFIPKNTNTFRVIVCEKELYDFGQVKKIKDLLK